MKFSLRQILASAAGAVLAALIASSFGVKGTIVGVAIGSAAATIGTAVVAQSIERGHEAVKQAVVRAPESAALIRRLGGTGASGASTSSVDDSSAPTETVSSTTGGDADTVEVQAPAAPADETRPLEVSAAADAAPTAHLRSRVTPPAAARTPADAPRRFTWKAVAGTAAVVFVLALLFVTAVELIAGKPLSAIFGHGGTGTSLNNVVNPPSAPASTTTTTTPPSTTTSSSSTTTSTTTTTTVPGASTTTTSPSPSTTTTTGPSATTTTTTSPVSGLVP